MVTITKLDNGLVVILEPLDYVESASYDLFVPGGIVHDAENCVGASLILPELTSRGAGGLSSRELSNAYENLGIRHAESASQEHAAYRGACLGENLAEALRLTSLLVLEPALPAAEIENIQSSLILELRSLEDNPARRVGVELSNRYFPAPYNRSSYGTASGIQNTTAAILHDMWSTRYKPEGSVLSIAGNFDADEILEVIGKYFGSWSGHGPARIPYATFPPLEAHHIEYESAQLQIMLASPSALFGDPDYYVAKLANGILSGGMFGRLFVEVREKRGLCYSVYSRHAANMHYGNTVAYAGTTPERAHETLEVMLEVLRSLSGTVEPAELNRARANLNSALVMGEESASSRAASNATDYWISGKVRALDEIKSAIDAVTVEDIEQFSRTHQFEECMLVTLGSRTLETKAVIQ